MFSVIRPEHSGPMLEIGAGIGTFSERLLGAGAQPLVLVEPEHACADELRSRFADNAAVEVVEEMLPDSPTLRARPAGFVYALCQNVLEHIDDDLGALSLVVDCLEPGGEMLILVPAHPRLFGRLDVRFGHRRRYTRSTLRELVAGAGAEVVSVRAFNLLGIPGWFLACRAPGLDISPRSLRVYEAVLRWWRPVEDALRPPVGLSYVARVRKPVTSREAAPAPEPSLPRR